MLQSTIKYTNGTIKTQEQKLNVKGKYLPLLIN